MFLLFLSDAVLADQMTGFEIRHCAKGSCFVAKGKQSFVSMAQDSLSASDARLEIVKPGGADSQVYNCASLNYDLVTQLLICDNQAIGQASLTISAQLNIKKFN